MKKSILLHGLISVLVAVTLQGFTPATNWQEKDLKGIVVSGKNGKPLKDVLVYALAGEEEALTDAEGKFHLNTFQKIPLVLTAEKPQYKKLKITVTSFSEELLIRLPPQ